jgi:hypothetical protein
MATSPLHITNGDADAKKVGEILREETLPWRDFLHDGPVRLGLLLEGPLYCKSRSSVSPTRLGLAFPLDAFMTWPFRKLMAAVFPSR